MPNVEPEMASRRPSGLEENLKKALTELLILFLFNEQEHYIGELSPLLEQRSHGTLSIVFPYAAIYRITKAGYLTETKKRNAPDGRLRQYYKITESGQPICLSCFPPIIFSFKESMLFYLGRELREPCCSPISKRASCYLPKRA